MTRVITIWTSVPGTLQAGKQWLLERFVWFELCHVILDQRCFSSDHKDLETKIKQGQVCIQPWQEQNS